MSGRGAGARSHRAMKSMVKGPVGSFVFSKDCQVGSSSENNDAESKKQQSGNCLLV